MSQSGVTTTPMNRLLKANTAAPPPPTQHQLAAAAKANHCQGRCLAHMYSLSPGVQRVEHVPVWCDNHPHEQAVEGTHSHVRQTHEETMDGTLRQAVAYNACCTCYDCHFLSVFSVSNTCAAHMLIPWVQRVKHVPVRCQNHPHEQAVESPHPRTPSTHTAPAGGCSHNQPLPMEMQQTHVQPLTWGAASGTCPSLVSQSRP
jgi:hypothetical protein